MGIHGYQPTSQSELKGMPFQLMVIFKYNGHPVTVTYPKVRLISADGNQVQSFEALDSFPLNPDKTEWELNTVANTVNVYEITIDPLSLPIGVYKAVFEGDINTGTKTFTQQIKGTIGLGELSRSDRIVSMARDFLMDYPEEYLFKPQIHQFKASSLFKFMEHGIQHYNLAAPPVSTFTLDDLPANVDAIIVDYIVAMCLFGKARLGVENDVTINDSRSVSIDTHGKYMSMYQAAMQSVNDAIKSSKALTRPSPIGHRRARAPFWAARIISMMPQYRNTFLMSPR